MDTRYSIFFNVLEEKSFTRAAEKLGYSQSAVSQAVHSLESELGTVLLERTSRELSLTKDGEQYLPYLRSILTAQEALERRTHEMQGLVHSTIRIGTFTSISRNLLPLLMKEFRDLYPTVSFELIQGEYNSITADILSGRLDFGFVNQAFVNSIETVPLFQDTMAAVLPLNHPLAERNEISLQDLVEEPFIELDEGEHSVAIEAFHQHKLSPCVYYKVTDDYSILAMVRQGLGYSILYKLVLAGYAEGVKVVPIKEPLHRTIALAWRNHDTLPTASRIFADYIHKRIPALVSSMDL